MDVRIGQDESSPLVSQCRPAGKNPASAGFYHDNRCHGNAKNAKNRFFDPHFLTQKSTRQNAPMEKQLFRDFLANPQILRKNLHFICSPITAFCQVTNFAHRLILHQ